MFYKQAGNVNAKKTLVLLHGFSGNENSLDVFIKPFESEYRIISFALHSIEKTQPLFLCDYSKNVLSVLLNLNIKKADFIVHSFGARVVARLNDLNTELINKIVFIGAAGIKPRFNLNKWFKIKLFKICKFFNFKKLENFGSSDYRRLSPIMKQTFKNIINDKLESLFKKITAPCLIICGTCDRETPPYMSKKIRRLIKNSNIELIKESGHFCYLEQSQTCILLAQFFLNC